MELFNEKIEGLEEAYSRDVDALKDLSISPSSLLSGPYHLSYGKVEHVLR
jgi:hypothetical protein